MIQSGASDTLSALPMASTEAIILMGHGSRDIAGAREFLTFAERLSARLARPIYPGFLELADPPIAEAIDAVVKAGAQSIVAIPWFLLGAGHVKNDVPAALQWAHKRYPQVVMHYGSPINIQPEILALLADRLTAIDPDSGMGSRETAVLLVQRGSSDPEANADVYRAARFLWEGRKYSTVEVAFSGVAQPSLAEGLQRCLKYNPRHVLVLLYYLYTGVLVERIGFKDPLLRTEVVKRRIAFESHPVAFYEHWQVPDAALRIQIERARSILPQVVVSDTIIGLIAHICIQFKVEGLRADITIYKAAIALAALEGRTFVIEQDVQRIAAMALPHRLPKQPFEQPGLDPQELEKLIHEYQPPEPEQRNVASDAPSMQNTTHTSPPSASHASEREDQKQEMQERPMAENAESEAPEQVIPPGLPTAIATLTQKRPNSPLPSALKNGIPLLLKAARMGLALPQVQARGRIVGARHPIKQPSSLALAPTLRGAALHQKRRQTEHGSHGQRLWLERWDLFEPVRQQKQETLVLFAVDASGSMAARKRMAAAKGAVLALLQRAYQQRNHVGLLQFRGTCATLLLPPTNSTSRAIHALAHLPTGGRTPLASGLRLALRTLQVARICYVPACCTEKSERNRGDSGEKNEARPYLYCGNRDGCIYCPWFRLPRRAACSLASSCLVWQVDTEA